MGDGCTNAKAELRTQVLRHEPTHACAAGLEITWRGGPDYNNSVPLVAKRPLDGG